jgi:hypothetical protein
MTQEPGKLAHQKALDADLIAYNPRLWRINRPGRGYSLRREDLIPALSGAIGKVSLVAAFAYAWVEGLGITDPTFVVENVRLEIVIGSLLTLLFSALLLPTAGPPGTLAPLIPLIPVMAAAGVHPLPFGLLVGLLGLLAGGLRLMSRIADLNGPGTRSSVLLMFGLLGLQGALGNLRSWTAEQPSPGLLPLLILAGTAVYIVLNRYGARWLVIPLSAGVALVIAALYGRLPAMGTGIGLPILDPAVWWLEKWGIGYGLTMAGFLRALPFALLVLALWPTDALAVRSMQSAHYPPEARRAILDLNATYVLVAFRNILGVLLGGAQTAAVWRSFMIPLGVVRRPIGGSALLLGLFGLAFGFLGFPIDLAVFAPLVWLVLIFGVFVPLLEVGISGLTNLSRIRIALAGLVIGIGVDPVVGWSAALLLENLGILPSDASDRPVAEALGWTRKIGTLAIALITLGAYAMIGRIG